MRKEFEMTQEDLDKLKEASKPVPAIALHCGPITSPQENAAGTNVESILRTSGKNFWFPRP